MRRPAVHVIGAGLSGLAAARRLAASGRFDVTVHERAADIGGRRRTLVLTLGALAELESAFAADDLVALAGHWGTLLFMVVIGLMMFVVPAFSHVSMAVLASTVFTILYIQQPLNGIVGAVPWLGRSSIAVMRVEQMGMKLVAEGPVKDLAPAPARPVEQIELVGITHTYRGENPDETFKLGPLQLTVNRGELLFLVGGNGSGKTTLAKVLTGLYAPESGEIRVDGQPVKAEERDDYRQLFSAVFFDFFLFERLPGARSPQMTERAQQYLAELHLDRKVRLQDGTLSRLDLSQGQRKRLALLMAYLEDRPVYLFDEWAADQDPLFKELFYKQILPDLKSRGKAVVIISHDDRYFRLADRLVYMDSGQIISDAAPMKQVGT